MDPLDAALAVAWSIPLRKEVLAPELRNGLESRAELSLPQIVDEVERLLGGKLSSSYNAPKSISEDIEELDIQAELGCLGDARDPSENTKPDAAAVGVWKGGTEAANEERLSQWRTLGVVFEDGKPFRGQLSEEPLYRILVGAYLARLSGLIRFDCPNGQRQLLFLGGNLLEISSTAPCDRITEILFEQGRLTEDAYRAAKAATVLIRDREGSVLLNRGFILPRELFPLVKHAYDTILWRLFACVEGTWEYEPNRRSTMRILFDRPVPALVMWGFRLNGGALASFGALSDTDCPVAQGKGICAIEELGLTKEEMAVYGSLSGTATVAELAGRFATDVRTMSGLVLGLRSLGFVHFGVENA